MSFTQVDYFRLRAIEERIIAASSDMPGAISIHRSLAEKYEALIQLFETGGAYRLAPASSAATKLPH